MYTLQLSTEPGGPPLLPGLSSRCEALAFAYNRHGCADAQTSLALNTDEVYALYNAPAAPHMTVAYAGGPIWSGRLEQATPRKGGIDLISAGYWRAFTDVPYTAVWSDTNVSQWRYLTDAEESTAAPGKYEFDTKNRLWITPKRGETHGGPAGSQRIAFFAYAAPDRGNRVLTTVSFTYTMNVPSANWVASLIWYSAAPSGASWTRITTLNFQSGSGVGTINQTLTGSPVAIAISLFDSSNPGSALAADTGVNYLLITGLRIKSTSASSVLASDIANGLASYTNGINPSQLLAGSRIVPTTLDLRDEIYEDEYPADILDRLAKLENYQAMVTKDRQLAFIPRGSEANTWRIDASAVEVQRALDRVRNRRYGVYQDAANRILRTANADNALSQARYGLIRSAPLDVRTTSATQAGTQRDTALADSADPSPRAGITIRRLLSAQGQIAPLHAAQPGDTAVIANLPPTASVTDDQVRTFEIGRVAISLVRNQRAELTIEPDEPTPRLDTMLAQLAKTPEIAPTPIKRIQSQ